MATSYTAPPGTIMVEDPHGHVVPSPGVEIVGRIGRDLITPTQVSNLINSGHHIEQLDTLQFGRVLHQRPIPKGPLIKVKARKPKRLHRGLR